MTRFKLSASALLVAAAAAVLLADGTAAFASELPTYEAKGFPISPVQASVLGAADVREAAADQAASPHRLRVPAPQRNLTAAAEAGRATR